MARTKRKPRLCFFVCVALLCAIVVVVLCAVLISKRGCSDGNFKHAAVAADSLTCSEIGRDILQRGGSAVDGAIAALLCTSLVHPQSMGLGGGAIFTIREKSGKVTIINSRETVPKTFKPDLMKDCPNRYDITTNSQWIGVPGELRGYERAHSRFGRLPWAELFQPAIKLARDGFPLPHVVAEYLKHPQIKKAVEKSRLCDILCNENKTVLKEGETVRYPRLAETMATIAEHGADALYTGKIAEDLVRDVQEQDGTLSLEDLRSYEAKVTDPLVTSLGEYELYIPPPPFGGPTLAFILKIMEGFNLTPSSIEGQEKALTYHRFAEAIKFAHGQRKSVKDSLKLIEDDFANRIRAMIRSNTTLDPQYYNSTPSFDHHGTAHMSLLAEDGTAVFGCRVFSHRTGLILNSELSDFCGFVDHISSGEQPPSFMCPAMLVSRKKQKLLVIGASGGSSIPTGIAMTIMDHLWFGKNLSDAISAPRLFVNSENAVRFEANFSEEVKNSLKKRGHKEGGNGPFFNVVNAVTKDGSCITAFSDRRKHGQSAGY